MVTFKVGVRYDIEYGNPDGMSTMQVEAEYAGMRRGRLCFLEAERGGEKELLVKPDWIWNARREGSSEYLIEGGKVVKPKRA